MAIEEIRPLVVLQPGSLYIESHLDATVGALVRLYTTRGFRWASVKSGATEAGTEGGVSLVRPSIVIVEGPRAVLDQITVTGASAVSESEVRRLLQIQPGQPFYEPSISNGRDAVQLEYLNLGFSSAEVQLTPALSEDRTRVSLNVAIREGAQTFVDHLIVVGNRRTSEEVIRREVLLRPGAPLGLRDLLESRRRLSALGLFRRIDIRQVEHGSSSRRDVLVTVEEAPATTISYGGGAELTRILREDVGGQAVERIELAPRGFFDIGRRNLGGKNRSVSLFTRVSVRPEGRAGQSRGRRHRPRPQRIPAGRNLSRAGRHALECRPDVDRRDRAGPAVELQLHAPGRNRGSWPQCDPDRPNQRSLRLQHHQDVRRAPR
jgi:outer membrane protein assembly factor BamA